VTLDLTRPEHRKALRWACELPAARRAVRAARAAESLGASPRLDALRALSCPSDCAAIVRATLDGCGVVAVDLYQTPAADRHVDLWHVDAGLCCQFPETRAETFPVLRVPMAGVPALILRLLACTECRGVKVNGKRYGCRKSEPRIGDAPACPTCADTGIARTTEARDGALAALREAGR
jgi:hypothetical protein